MRRKVSKSNRQWKRELTPEQFEACRKGMSERPFTGRYIGLQDSGVYRCICCGSNLFKSEAGFHSGFGWPSFSAPITEGRVKTKADESYFMERRAVLCATCGARIGHLINGARSPTGRNYFINSVCIEFVKDSRHKAQGKETQ